MTGSAKLPQGKRSPPLSEVVPANPITPLAQRSMFWRPVYVEQSVWLEHIPFAFWLVEAQQPRVMVELGTGDGVSYFAFCQAVERLGLDTRCFGVEISEGAAASEPLRVHNEAQYSGFSRLLRSRPDDALRHFEDASIDLLHIDGRDAAEAVLADLDACLGKLSPRAIVLIHGINERERSPFRLFQALARKHSHFDFTHGSGLGVLGIGAEQDPRVERLLQASPVDPTRQAVHQVFARLGDACADAYKASRQQLRVAELAQDVEKQTLLLSEVQQSLQGTRLELDARSAELAHTRSRLQAQLEQHALERGMLAERVELLQQLRSEFKEEVGRLQQGLAQTASELTEASARLASFQAEAHAAGEGLLKLKEKNLLLVGELAQRDRLLAEARVGKDEAQRASAQLREELRARAIELTSRADEQAQQELRDREAALAPLMARSQAAESQLATLQDALAARERALAEALETLALREQRIAQLESASHQYELESRQHEADLAIARNGLLQREARIEELTGALARQGSAAQEDGRARQAQLAALQAELAKAGEAHEKSRAALRQLELARVEQAGRIDELQAERSSLSERLALRSVELDEALQGKLAALQDAERLAAQIEERDAALAAGSAETARLQQLTRALEASLHAAVAAQQEAERQGAQVQAELAALLQQAASERAAFEHAKGLLTDERERLSAQLQERFAELALLVRLLEEREAVLAAAEAEAARWRERSVALEDSLQGRMADLQQAQAQSAQGEADKAALEAARQALEAKLDERFRELAVLTRLLDERDADLSVRSHEIEQMRLRLARLKETFSWQLTAPVRALVKPFTSKRSEQEALREKIALIAHSGLFDEPWYVSRYPEVARSDMEPIAHYLQRGAAEAKNPGPAFDTGWYVRTYADVAVAKLNPLIHYIRFGRREGRACRPASADETPTT